MSAARALGFPSGSPLRAPGHWQTAWWAGLVVAYAGWLVAILLLARAPVTSRTAFGVAVLIQGVPLLAPILLSGDIYAYQKYGRSSDPYGEFGDLSDVYGPLWTLVSKLFDALGGSSYLFRGLALCCVLAVTAIAGRLATRKSLAIAFVGWNPLVAVHFTGGGHVDAFMMLFGVGALLAARAGRPQAAGAAWALSVFVKWVTIAFAALWTLEQRSRGRSAGLVGAAAAAAVTLVASWAFFGFSWLHAFYLLGLQARQRGGFGTFAWLEDLGLGRHAAIALGDAAQVAAFLVLALRARRGRLHLGLAAGVLLVLSPKFQPSYLLWPLALAATDDEDRWGRALAAVLTGVLLSDAFTSALDA